MSLGVLQNVLQNVPFRVLLLCCFGCAHNHSTKTFGTERSPKTFGTTGRGTPKAFAQPQNGSAKRMRCGGGCRWQKGYGEARGRRGLQSRARKGEGRRGHEGTRDQGSARAGGEGGCPKQPKPKQASGTEGQPP